MKYFKSAVYLFTFCSFALSALAMDTGSVACEDRQEKECEACGKHSAFVEPFECGHAFHRECFNNIFRGLGDERICPTCGSPLKPQYCIHLGHFEIDHDGNVSWVPNYMGNSGQEVATEDEDSD